MPRRRGRSLGSCAGINDLAIEGLKLVARLLEQQIPSKEDEDLRGFEWFYLWNLVQRGQTSTTLQLGRGSECVAISSDGTVMAATKSVYDETRDKAVDHLQIWDVKTQRELRAWERAGDDAIEFLPDSDIVVFNGPTDKIIVWNWKLDQELASIPCKFGHVMDVLPDGKMIAGVTGADISIWDTVNFQEVTSFGPLAGTPFSMEFSPDSKTLAVGQTNAKIALWDVGTSTVKGNLIGHDGRVCKLAFHGQLLASASIDFLVKVLGVTKLQQIANLEGHTRWVRCVAFSPDGQQLASCGNDNTIKLWDATNWQELETLKGHGNRVYSVAFPHWIRPCLLGCRPRTTLLTPNASARAAGPTA